MADQHSGEIVATLHHVLNQLVSNPCPHVSNPDGCKKRASVAVVIRVRPAYSPVPEAHGSIVHIEPRDSAASSLDDFFSREWVRHGDAEVLFIKRAGRVGDSWSGHIALPGGRRDADDESDIAAAIRETREEVGLDLRAPNCLPVGDLPERVVATTGRREALMVLCPYIFLYTSKDVPRVSPQPTEVASAHWVPIRALLSPNLRTSEYVDTSSRMVKQGGPVAGILLRTLIGSMVFSAIRLAPSESIFASSIPGFIPSTGETRLEMFLEGAFGIAPKEKKKGLTHQQPLLLWGLTLGILADLLDMLPPHNAVDLWRYPTFTAPDLRLLVWMLTRGSRQNNAGDLSAGTWPSSRLASQTAVDATTEAIAVMEPKSELKRNEVGISGLAVGSQRQDASSKLLAGYYERINVAVGVFVAYRTILGSAAAYWVYKMWHNRRSG
ncbi:NUDIX hydrolase domain-like protein [Pseudomassariella vexata]|uniref:NUDIX hydrolase domain-like protein n=1 Tax=Pseudomassariella vexata TaxID=1141098 RepID=A0A1Y2D7U9_9PEZI|nr:NUDIX hydrolase domain-like protein [Pseudomassariella vexata]ORY55254.1 NUDIX hydrolase domain-like protein [Pseudomassariella vexata]